jgi:hypothetical protein
MCYTPVPMSQELTDQSSLEHQNWSPELDQYLSDIAKGTRGFNKPAGKGSHKQRFLQATNEVFDLIGGVPRYALWADQNPDKFYSLFAKTIPAAVAQTLVATGPVTIVSPIGRSKLDDDPVDGEFQEVPNGT